jgi:hypothetical protein
MGTKSNAHRPSSSIAATSRMILLSGIMATAISASSAIAAPVGVTVDAATKVTGTGPGGSREIVKNSPIFSDDRLNANRTGNAQIILVDKTKIVVGPNAQVDITDFVYDNSAQNSFKSITIKATKGTFRIFTGASKPSAFKIQTPAGSIGIRG